MKSLGANSYKAYFPRFVRGITFLFLSILLCSCGFKLRGLVSMPIWLTNVAVEVRATSPELAVLLYNELKAFHVAINPDPTKADYLLIIERDNLQRQLTSVSASTTPRQYQLYYTIWYSLLTTKAKPLITSDSVTISRQLTVNNDLILGSDFEDSTIVREMRREAAMRVLSHLSRKAATLNVD